MIYWTIFFCAIYAVLSIQISKKIINPMLIFMLVWAVMLFMNSLRLLTLYKTEDKYYQIMALGFHSYFVGYLISSLMKRKSNHNRVYILRNQFLYGLSIIILAILLVKFFSIFNSATKYGLANIRKGLQTGELEIYSSNSVLMSMLWHFIVYPGRLALSVIVSVNLLEKSKKNKLLLILYILIIALSVLTDGGRSIILYLMIHLSLSYYYTYQPKPKDLVRNKYVIRISKKTIPIVSLCIVGIIAFYYATIARSGAKSLIHLYFYGSISPVMFQIWSKTVETSGLFGFGLASINGFISPLLYLIKTILGSDDLPFYWGQVVQKIYDTDQIWVRTSALSKSNAYVSLFWFFFLDGRLLGVIWGMFIYGLLSNTVFKNYMKYRNAISLSVLQFWIQGLLFSGVRLQFAIMPYALALVIIYLSFSKRNQTVAL